MACSTRVGQQTAPPDDLTEESAPAPFSVSRTWFASGETLPVTDSAESVKPVRQVLSRVN